MFHVKMLSMNTPLERVREIIGSDSEIARAYETSRQLVGDWFRKGYLPYRRAYDTERITKGRITAMQVFEAAHRAQK